MTIFSQHQRLYLFVIFILPITSSSHIDSLWTIDDQQQCDNSIMFDPNTDRYNCFLLFQSIFFLWSKIELVNRNPTLFIIHQLSHSTELTAIRNIAQQQIMQETLIMGSPNRPVGHVSRRANGTWLDHEHHAVAQIYRRAQRITGFNLRSAEDWQLLSYESGGYYIPHYDYLDVPSNRSHYDSWMRHLGNRMATLLVIVERAGSGGATIFPHLRLTLLPEPGDAILWFNMHVDGSRERRSLHGGCPIRAGTKLAMALWIRERGQEFSVRCPREPIGMSFDMSSFAAFNRD